MAEDRSAQQTLEKTDKTIEDASEALQAAMEAWVKAREDSLKYAPNRRLAKAINGKEPVMAYKVRGKCADKLERKMLEERVGFIRVADDMFIIRKADYQDVAAMNRDANILMSNYFQEVSADEMEATIANSNLGDKTMFSVQGLDAYEKTVLRNKCNNITRGFMVGTRETGDNEYEINVRGKYVYNAAAKNDLCHAMLSMSLSLYGGNEIKKKEQIDHDFKMDALIQDLKGCEEPHYIIGMKDVNDFVTLDSTGFTYSTTAIGKDGLRHTANPIHVDIDSDDYENELKKCLDGIENKQVITDPAELQDHINGNLIKSGQLEGRPMKTLNEAELAEANTRMSNQIDMMIKQKLRGRDPLTAFPLYKKEVEKLIDGVEKDTLPPGYKKEEMDNLKNMFKSNDIDVKDFRAAVDKGFGKMTMSYDAMSHTKEEVRESRENAKEVISRVARNADERTEER